MVFVFVTAVKTSFLFQQPNFLTHQMKEKGVFNTKAHFLASLLFQLIQEDQQQDLLAHVHV